MNSPPVLLVLTGKHKGKRVRLTDPETIIGRDEAAKIRVATHEVSRQHTLLIITPAGLLVRDLSSRNGTFINGVPIAEETILNPGDTLSVGPMTFELEGGEVAPAPAATTKSTTRKKDPKASDDDIAGWLTDETDEGLSTSDTTILSGKPKPAAAPPAKVKAPKREFKSVAEEAADIIRRHLESLKE